MIDIIESIQDKLLYFYKKKKTNFYTIIILKYMYPMQALRAHLSHVSRMSFQEKVGVGPTETRENISRNREIGDVC